MAGQRGFTSFGKEHAKGFDAPDLKEFFQVGQEVEDGDPVAADYPENVQVAEVTDFLPSMMEAYRRFEDAGKAVLSAIAIYLNLSPDHFDSFVHNGNSILRAIYYPPITSEPASAIRAEQHEDINLITLLIGASADGLELLTKENNWMPVKVLPGQIVVNVGDMLQAPHEQQNAFHYPQGGQSAARAMAYCPLLYAFLPASKAQHQPGLFASVHRRGTPKDV